MIAVGISLQKLLFAKILKYIGAGMKRIESEGRGEDRAAEIHGWHINNVFLFGGHWHSSITAILW